VSRVIAAKPVLKIRRGDNVAVVAGRHKGEKGVALCAFKGWVTIDRGSGQAFQVVLAECEKAEAADCDSGQ
jgi:hypothetical protein